MTQDSYTVLHIVILLFQQHVNYLLGIYKLVTHFNISLVRLQVLRETSCSPLLYKQSNYSVIDIYLRSSSK